MLAKDFCFLSILIFNGITFFGADLVTEGLFLGFFLVDALPLGAGVLFWGAGVGRGLSLRVESGERGIGDNTRLFDINVWSRRFCT